MVSFNSITIFYLFKKILYVSSAKPDQTPRSVATDLVLHCLHTFHKKEAMLIWVN